MALNTAFDQANTGFTINTSTTTGEQRSSRNDGTADVITSRKTKGDKKVVEFEDVGTPKVETEREATSRTPVTTEKKKTGKKVIKEGGTPVTEVKPRVVKESKDGTANIVVSPPAKEDDSIDITDVIEEEAPKTTMPISWPVTPTTPVAPTTPTTTTSTTTYVVVGVVAIGGLYLLSRLF